MSRRERAAALALAATLLVGCSHPSAGRIVGKHYEPERTYTTCSLVGKITVCSPRTDDEDWVITLRNGEDEWDVEVDHAYYDRASVGDTWTAAAS